MNMKKIIATVCMVSFGMLLQPLALAAEEFGTAPEAIAMVKKAVAFYKANGKEKAFAEFNNPKGKFIDRDLYILVLDSNIVMLAHGTNPRLIGKSLIDSKDADGKPFAREFYEIGNTKGTGWVDYKWPNPVKQVIDSKSTYVEKVDDILIACGIYKK
jgi:cytochrome c